MRNAVAFSVTCFVLGAVSAVSAQTLNAVQDLEAAYSQVTDLGPSSPRRRSTSLYG